MIFCIDETTAALELRYRECWNFPLKVSPREVILLQTNGAYGVLGSATLTEEASQEFYSEALNYYLWLKIRGFEGYQLTEAFYQYLAELSDRTLPAPTKQQRWSIK